MRVAFPIRYAVLVGFAGLGVSTHARAATQGMALEIDNAFAGWVEIETAPPSLAGTGRPPPFAFRLGAKGGRGALDWLTPAGANVQRDPAISSRSDTGRTNYRYTFTSSRVGSVAFPALDVESTAPGFLRVVLAWQRMTTSTDAGPPTPTDSSFTPFSTSRFALNVQGIGDVPSSRIDRVVVGDSTMAITVPPKTAPVIVAWRAGGEAKNAVVSYMSTGGVALYTATCSAATVASIVDVKGSSKATLACAAIVFGYTSAAAL